LFVLTRREEGRKIIDYMHTTTDLTHVNAIVALLFSTAVLHCPGGWQ